MCFPVAFVKLSLIILATGTASPSLLSCPLLLVILLAFFVVTVVDCRHCDTCRVSRQNGAVCCAGVLKQESPVVVSFVVRKTTE